MRVPVEEFLVAKPTLPQDEPFQLFLQHVGLELVKRDVLKPGMNWVREKAFPDCLYIDVPQVGLSFAFDKGDGDKHVLSAIHVFKDVRQYRYCDWLELPFEISLKCTIKDIVTKLGEPPKKSGGNGIAITVIYDHVRPAIGLQCEFNGCLWEDPDNDLQCLTFFKTTS